jgi:hypothetical protein
MQMKITRKIIQKNRENKKLIKNEVLKVFMGFIWGLFVNYITKIFFN